MVKEREQLLIHSHFKLVIERTACEQKGDHHSIQSSNTHIMQANSSKPHSNTTNQQQQQPKQNRLLIKTAKRPNRTSRDDPESLARCSCNDSRWSSYRRRISVSWPEKKPKNPARASNSPPRSLRRRDRNPAPPSTSVYPVSRRHRHWLPFSRGGKALRDRI